MSGRVAGDGSKGQGRDAWVLGPCGLGEKPPEGDKQGGSRSVL